MDTKDCDVCAIEFIAPVSTIAAMAFYVPPQAANTLEVYDSDSWVKLLLRLTGAGDFRRAVGSR